MGKLELLRLAFPFVGVVLIAFDAVRSRSKVQSWRIAHLTLGVLAVAHIFLVLFLWINHLGFPLNLDLMEGTVLQHAQLAADFKPIYPEPAPEYVPLAYNPLYYVLAVPLGWFFHLDLSTLRLVAILGMLGTGLVLYLVTRQHTKSGWWALAAVGLFAAAYRAMDTYLDNAHSDSWFLFTALLGSYLIDRNRSRSWNLIGVALLIASFWFKQHGALFVIGGVLFLTWREGIRRSLMYWLEAILLGPALYFLAGPLLFGPRFHYFTWDVPRGWTELNRENFSRILSFAANWYPLLALSSLLTTAWIALKNRKGLSIWHFQLVFAILTGFMGTLDHASADNIFIPMGAWFILMGTLGFYELVLRVRRIRIYQIQVLLVLVAFAGLLYNPLDVVVSSRADESFEDLVGLLSELDGSVYAPWLGQLSSGYTLYPAAHWVALEDMIRGPGRDTQNHPTTRVLLGPSISPQGPAHILTNYRLEDFILLDFLLEYYVLETDFGDRFKPLQVLPKRFDHGWPRYLYRYDPRPAATPEPVGNPQTPGAGPAEHGHNCARLSENDSTERRTL